MADVYYVGDGAVFELAFEDGDTGDDITGGMDSVTMLVYGPNNEALLADTLSTSLKSGTTSTYVSEPWTIPAAGRYKVVCTGTKSARGPRVRVLRFTARET